METIRRTATLTLTLALLAGCGPFNSIVDPNGGGGAREATDGGPGPTGDAGVPFAVEVVTVTYGAGAGYGQEEFPDAVLGPPAGGGARRGSLKVLTLGKGGVITLRMGRDAVDGPGVDLLVFENAFIMNASGTIFAEPAEVAVSEDGVTFTAFPCDSATPPYAGCAGASPVLAPGADGGISPVDPAVAGGDGFDLAQVGLARARYVRIRDLSTADPVSNNSGFDLDAVAVVAAAAQENQ